MSETNLAIISQNEITLFICIFKKLNKNIYKYINFSII